MSYLARYFNGKLIFTPRVYRKATKDFWKKCQKLPLGLPYNCVHFACPMPDPQ